MFLLFNNIEYSNLISGLKDVFLFCLSILSHVTFCSIGWSGPAPDHGHDQETRGRPGDEQPDADHERRQRYQVSVKPNSDI